MNKFKYVRFAVSIALGVLLYGCQQAETAPLNRTATRVAVQEVKPVSAGQIIAYSGTIEAKKSVALSFSVNGTVKQVLFDEGDFVHRGQALAVLDDATLRNAYRMAKATLDQAEDAYRRLKPMYEKGNLPEIKFVEVQTRLQQAKASTAIAQKNLNDCTLYAPRDGFIGKRSVEAGQNVLPGISVFTLVNMDVVTARMQVAEGEISAIQVGLPAQVRVGALNNRSFTGKVRHVGVVADPIAHTYTVRIEVPNPGHLIKPGMICEIQLEGQNPQPGLLVPNASIRVDEDGEQFVIRVNKQSALAERQPVKTGRLLDDGIEVLSGLNTGDLVVVSGMQKLTAGMPVEIMTN